jgi:ParB family chromosome partitioning protein
MVQAQELEMGHARTLLGLKSPAEQQTVAQQVVVKGLSVRETEALVRRLQSAPARATPEKRADPDIRRLEEDLSQRLGAAVRFQHGTRGKGKVIIHYNSLEELEGILVHFR